MSRFAFNIIIFLVFIPVFILQVNSFSEKINGDSNTITSSKELLSKIFTEAPQKSTSKEQLEYLKQQRKALQEVAEITDIENFVKSAYTPKKETFNKTNIINFIIYILIIPIIAMRFRDLGVWNNHKITFYITIAYLPIILQFLQISINITIPTYISFIANTVSFITLMLLCSKKSIKLPPPSERQTYD